MTRIFRFNYDGLPFEEFTARNFSTSGLGMEWMINSIELKKEGIHYWTYEGIERYRKSGMRDEHFRLTRGKIKLLIAEIPTPNQILYQDDFQVILKDPKGLKEETLTVQFYDKNNTLLFPPTNAYNDLPPPLPNALPDRPHFIKRDRDLQDFACYSYPEDSETFSLGAPLSRSMGLQRLGIHHEVLPPGKRTSWPHAHKEEEEFIYVLEGKPHVWVNGEIFPLNPGDCVAFVPGTGLAHTFINNTQEMVRLLVCGESGIKNDQIFYPLHPQINQKFKARKRYWEDHPDLPLGDHDGLPEAMRKKT